VGAIVSGNTFDDTGCKAADSGARFFPEEDRTPNTHPVVVIGYGCGAALGADPNVLGRTIVLNEHDCMVIGVLPRIRQPPLCGPRTRCVDPGDEEGLRGAAHFSLTIAVVVG